MRRRIDQFFHAGRLPDETDLDLARRWLDGPLLDLCLQQSPRDVVHGAATARWLLDRGHDDAALIQAALLHDIGKGAQRRRDRVLWVLASSAGAGARVAEPGSRLEARRALARTATHAATGAILLREAGARPEAVRLTVLHHTRQPGDPMLRLLRAADAAN